MIHVKFLDDDALENLLLSEDESEDLEYIPSGGGLCAAFCVANKSEQAAYDEATHSSEDVQVSQEADTIETCEDRHEACMMCFDYRYRKAVNKPEPPTKRLTFSKDLAVLGACRLLYEESNNLLWESNTFSFDDPESLKRFISSMNPAQKSRLWKIHLSMRVPIDENNRSYSGPFQMWARAIPGRVLTPLKNLKILHLTFDQYSIWHRGPSNRDLLATTTSQEWVNHSMNKLLGLRMLPWKDKVDANRGKHVTVVVTDDASTHSEDVTPRWSRAQKLEAAEAFRALLADPNAMEIHKAEMEVARVEAAKHKVERDEQARVEKDEREYRRAVRWGI